MTVIKNILVLNNIEDCYNFNLEYNIKVMSNFYNIDYLLPSQMMSYEKDVFTDDRFSTNNNYFTKDNSNLEFIANDIKDNGMYFPFLGEYKDDIFKIRQGHHRFLASKFLEMNYKEYENIKYICISKKDNPKYSKEEWNNIILPQMFIYCKNKTFKKTNITMTNNPSSILVSSCFNISNDMFSDSALKFKPNLIINNENYLEYILNNNVIERYTNNEQHWNYARQINSIFK